MARRRVHVGLIGTSWWVDLMYVPSLLSHPEADVVAVCGRDAARAAAIGAKFGQPGIFSDYRALIASRLCDAVVIAVPDDLHCEMALAAIDAGLHVLCEKPLAGSASDARRMLERATAAKVRHMVLFTWRWQPQWRFVKRLLDQGYIGRCRYAELKFIGGFALDAGYKWRFDGNRANGVIGDLGSHMVDFAHWFLGDSQSVRADLRTTVDQSEYADPPPAPANDLGFLSLEMVSGARAEITASAINLLGDEGVRIEAAFYGDEGSIEAERRYFGEGATCRVRGVQKGETTFVDLPIPADLLEGGVDPTALFDPYLKQSAGPRLFIDAIVGDQPIEPDFAVGLRVQEIIDAALLSAREDRWVQLDG